MRLHKKVCLITGGGSGIGEASACMFAAEGARVAVVDIDPDNGKRVVQNIIDGGGQAIFVEADVSTPATGEKSLEEVLRCFGQVDVLLNNAGVSAIGDVAECTLEDWDRVMGVNARSVYIMSHYAIPIRGLCSNGTKSAIEMDGWGRRDFVMR